VTHLGSDIINNPESELRTHGMIFPMIYYIKQQDIEVKMRKPRIFIKTVTLISISRLSKIPFFLPRKKQWLSFGIIPIGYCFLVKSPLSDSCGTANHTLWVK
jgi:hypothetical protein